MTDIIINPTPDPCPRQPNDAKRSKRQAGGSKETGHVTDLWPYSEMQAVVLVVNGAKVGQPSDVLEFTTPEGCKDL